VLTNEMYESFYNDLEDKPFAVEATSEQVKTESLTVETPDETNVADRPYHPSSPTAASLFFCLPVERPETTINDTPSMPKIFIRVDGGILRHDVR